VYVIVAVPAEIPVTRPEVLLIVATEVAELLQVPPLTEELKVEFPLTQRVVPPEIVPALGAAVTVTVLVAVAVVPVQPSVPATE
jgi:hypothetical protein